MPELITAGYIYIAQPPLYKISKGKQIHYAFSDSDKNKILEASNQEIPKEHPRVD